MKTVNLLPQWYFDAHRQRRKLRMQLVGLIVVGAILAGWTWVGRQQLHHLQVQRDALVQQALTARDVSGDLLRRHAELHRLQNLQLAYRELGSTVPMSLVVQQILNNLTPGMALSHISIEVHSDPVKVDARIAADAHHPQRFHDVAHINVTGIAPDAMLIAQLIGKLSANPLFNDVSLNFSKAELLRDYDVRRFDILMNMDLDRVSGKESRENTPGNMAARFPARDMPDQTVHSSFVSGLSSFGRDPGGRHAG